MPSHIDRRQTLGMIAVAGAATLLSVTTALADDPIMGDIVLGDDAAPVTVIEYASFTCPHCADFHINTWPRFKAEYVDTGKVRFILREIYFDRYGLWASMVARCGGANAFYPVTDQLMKMQSVWTKVAPELIGGEIQKIGRLNGLSAEQLNACLSDQEYAKTLVETYQTNAVADEVTGTPAFLIDGEKIEGNIPFEQLAALVDARL